MECTEYNVPKVTSASRIDAETGEARYTPFSRRHPRRPGTPWGHNGSSLRACSHCRVKSGFSHCKSPGSANKPSLAFSLLFTRVYAKPDDDEVVDLFLGTLNLSSLTYSAFLA